MRVRLLRNFSFLVSNEVGVPRTLWNQNHKIKVIRVALKVCYTSNIVLFINDLSERRFYETHS